VRIALFLANQESLYQGQQRDEATSAARATGVQLDVFFAGGDAKRQRDAVFAMIRSEKPPEGLIVHPIEEAGLKFVAQEALRKGIAWTTVGRESEWAAGLAREMGGVAFCVTPDQRGIGRLQGDQYRALLPGGGTVLYVTGPSMAGASSERQAGMEESRGSLLSAIGVVGAWSEASGHDAVHAWLETTRGFVSFDLIGAQNDDMAVGALKAVRDASASFGKAEWQNLPAAGVDGMPQYGRRLVDDGTLAATIVVPATTGKAVELLAAVLRGGPRPPAVTMVPAVSYPDLGLLRSKSSTS